MNHKQKPNIITILVDDMGFSDLGCYGGEIDTPNLDALAGGGLRFTDFYCTPRCCPSRASLLTGLTPHKAGVGWMSFDWQRHCDDDADGYTGTLNRECITIAEALRGGGYRTYLSGKWHLTSELANRDTWPRARGFDRSFALISGGTSYFHPKELTLDDKFYLPPENTYFTDLIGDFSEQFVTGHAQSYPGDPFFLYVAFTAPHFPLEAPEQSVAKYRELYSKGWDVLRDERYRRMGEMGIIRKEWPLPPRPDSVPPWEDLTPEERVRQVENMATYAAMVEIMDRNVGKLVTALERAGYLDNTLITFLSDNGACAEGPVMGSKTHYGECWAHLSNTPFKLYKHFTLQGGVQTPFIAHWPAALRGDDEHRRNGSMVSDWTGCLYDIMPTFLDISGIEYPESYNGADLHPLDGTSFAHILHGSAGADRPDIYIEHEGNQMIRSGRYKLVRQHAEPERQLYDMTGDRTEMNDLAQSRQDLFVELSRKYDAWERNARVLPWERAGRYMSFHGFKKHGAAFKQEFEEALKTATPDDVVEG